MYIHFLYVEHKDFKINYIITIKSEFDTINNNEINKLLYENLYLNKGEEIKGNINYFALFYIKKGKIIKDMNKEIWGKLLKIFIKKINYINIIDDIFIYNLKFKNILLFDIEIYKNELHEYIVELQLM